MALDNINLNSLLRLFGLQADRRAAAVRADALEYVGKQLKPRSGGGDFHTCFWADAKRHAEGDVDLRVSTAARIIDYAPRARLYGALRDGFLEWWENKRRWINEPITVLPERISSPYQFVELEGVVKVKNVLALRIGGDRERLVYPYFSEKPALQDDVARLGLWLLTQAFPTRKEESLRILDVLRGNSFSLERHPLHGNEGALFVERYARMLHDWRQIVSERLPK